MHDASNSWHWDPKAMTWVANTSNGPITIHALGDSALNLEHWRLVDEYWDMVAKYLTTTNTR